ncbi:histidine kinase dimerization/phospho-acceptor domain-containing protein [Sphingomonas floccifaciens]|uniref:histidine kinase n=1 Tax=Sphingomonas floccifaciens TaxID=1844115 RepID=A0ABW4N7M7_9SPHN
MRLIAAAKAVAKRHWPALSLRTILFGTLLFVAALPGVGAISLRVYENTLVQQTEAELIAQGAMLASAARIAWGAAPRSGQPPQPEPPAIDLRVDPVLPPAPFARPAGPPDPQALRIGEALAPMIDDAAAITLSSTRLLDRHGVVVGDALDRGRSYAALPEVRRALAGQPATVLRKRSTDPYSAFEVLSRAAGLRVHHVRPIVVDGRVVGAVMLSRSPRGLFLGIYQDRGKIALGVALIFTTLVVLAGLLSRGIARPIRALAAASEEVARGGTRIPEAPATAAIEIRELYDNFGAMAERIDHRTRYLRDFATAMSHEFKTPLTGIRGAIELLRDHGSEMAPDERRRFLNNASADADRLARLVQRLLDFARADLSSFDEAARADIVAVARRLTERDGSPVVHLVLPDDPVDARVDGETLATVLGTLIENSRQAGATTVTITVARRLSDATIRVADDGAGLAEADRARIFEAFFTGRREQGGTGLGLPIARSLLSVTGGAIALVPSATGACFEITLQRA